MLQGRLPVVPPSLRWFLVIENNLVGDIPSSFCNLSLIEVLILSKNNLGGVFPECFGNISSSIFHMYLRMNNFHGKIAGKFTQGCSLRSFNLNGNQLEGPLPRSLANCTYLELVDVGNNNIHDKFPNWLGDNFDLQVLVLQSNRFCGHIDVSDAFHFSNVRIIDVSHNDFIGHLPTKLFENLHAIRNSSGMKFGPEYMQYGGIFESTFITMKGLMFDFERILIVYTTIDFSNNRFDGQIPQVVGELHSLIVLNLSRNCLTGHIPSLLGNLSALESLDLSSNKLQGRIPVQLKNIIFLAVLNLSQNNLTGPIPRGNQFDTFTNDSYMGNLGLCGLPLSRSCGTPPPTTFHEQHHFTGELNWKFAILMGYGCGLVFGLSTGYIVFTVGKPWAIIRMVERAQRRICKTGGRK